MRLSDGGSGRRLGYLLAGALILATYAPFFDGCSWWLELFAHFRPQYCVLLALAALISFVWERRLLALALLFHSGLNLAVISPYLVQPEEGQEQAKASLRILLFNFNQKNTRYDDVIDFVKEHSPDVALFIEAGTEWGERLAELKAQMPYAVEHIRDDNFGIALYSRTELKHGRIEFIGEVQRPTVFADISLAGTKITLVGTHPVPPGSAYSSRMRNDHLLRLADKLSQQRYPVVFAGDLNVTPWSTYYRQFVGRSGLINAARGRWLFWTWPTALPPLAIPIDHILFSGHLRTKSLTKGPALGSDHFPLVADLELLR